jgi:hypothetical protein
MYVYTVVQNLGLLRTLDLSYFRENKKKAKCLNIRYLFFFSPNVYTLSVLEQRGLYKRTA